MCFFSCGRKKAFLDVFLFVGVGTFALGEGVGGEDDGRGELVAFVVQNDLEDVVGVGVGGGREAALEREVGGELGGDAVA